MYIIGYPAGEEVWAVLGFLPQLEEKELSASVFCVAGSIILIKPLTLSISLESSKDFILSTIHL